jgi:hypothetical protein
MKEFIDSGIYEIINLTLNTIKIFNDIRRLAMALFDNGLKGNILGGLAIGIGAAILAPVVLPVLASVAKPLAKAVIKSGFILYEKGKETIAEVGEIVEDIVAEAKAEYEEAQKEASTVATPGGETGA